MRRRVVLWHPDPRNSQSPHIAKLSRALRKEGVEVRGLNLRSVLGRRRIVHIHWPEHFVRSNRGLPRRVLKAIHGVLLCLLLTARGHRLVWTVHNLEPRTTSPMLRLLDRFIFGAISGCVRRVILLAPGQEAEAEAAFPKLRGVPTTTCRSGIDGSRLWARPASEGAASLLMLGALARDKRLLELAEAFADAQAQRPRSLRRLVLAGRPVSAPLVEGLLEISAREPGLTVVPRHVSEAELTELLGQVDGLISLMPFNSYAPVTALEQGLPIVMADNARSRDLQESLGERWVLAVSDRLDAEAIEAIYGWLRLERSRPRPSAFDLWSRRRSARCVASVYDLAAG